MMQLIAFYSSHMTISLIVMAIVGIAVGSFINVVIHRLPQMLEQEWRHNAAEILEQTPKAPDHTLSLCLPHSHCPQCQHPLSWWHNIPLLSYLCLLGRCAFCHQHISIRYPIVECLSAVMTVYLTWHFGITWLLLGSLLFSWWLIALIMIDLEHHLLPDELTLSLLWLGLLFNLTHHFAPLTAAVIGAIAGYLAFWLLYQGFKWITQKEGLGYGDFKLLAAIGAWLGWQSLPLVIMLSAILGLLFAILYALCNKRSLRAPIPYGPSLALAAWISLLWGPSLISMYWHWVS